MRSPSTSPHSARSRITAEQRAAAVAAMDELDQEESKITRSMVHGTTEPAKRAALLEKVADIYEQQARIRPDLGGRAAAITVFQKHRRGEAREARATARMEILRGQLVAAGVDVPDPLLGLLPGSEERIVGYISSLFELWLRHLGTGPRPAVGGR
ncbi:hypothetical protein [Amycolatopsis minnesotensis]|uniref:Uncharacterized protein n=1 Tax=Amycolatopsis minnesotensis TaxID=337894 RepID=A0ABN2SCN3_9PSEU